MSAGKNYTSIVKPKGSIDEPDINLVKVTIENDEIFRFEFCTSETDSNCSFIGSPEGYNLNELNWARRTKRLKAAGTNLLDIAVFAGLVTAGAYGGYVAGAMAAGAGGAFLGGAAGIGAGATSGSIAVLAVNFLSPTRRWKEANTISKRTIRELKIADVVIEGSTYDYARFLSGMLEQLD